MVQGKINRGRHTDHPAGRHSIRTNQCVCPPPPSPHIFYRPNALPAAQPTASKHRRLMQQKTQTVAVTTEVLSLESRRRWTGVSQRSLDASDVMMRPLVIFLGFSASSFLWCFGTVGWLTGMAKIRAAYPKDSTAEQVEEEDQAD